jgi:nitrite reductase (NADH) small subunit
MDFVTACPSSELPEGEKKIVTIAGREIALFRVGAQVFAIDNVCPHRGGPLGAGDLAGHVVYCPLHAWAFDVRSGESTSHPGVEIHRYAVQVLDGLIQVWPEGTRAHPERPYTPPYYPPEE